MIIETWYYWSLATLAEALLIYGRLEAGQVRAGAGESGERWK